MMRTLGFSASSGLFVERGALSCVGIAIWWSVNGVRLVLAKGTGAGDFGVGTIGVGGGIRRASSCICRG